MMIHKHFREGQTCRGTPLFQIYRVPLFITFGTIRIYTYFTLTTYPTENALPWFNAEHLNLWGHNVRFCVERPDGSVYRPTISIISSEISIWPNRLVGPLRYKVAPYDHIVNPVSQGSFSIFHLRTPKKENTYLDWPKFSSVNLLAKASESGKAKYLQNLCTGMYNT